MAYISWAEVELKRTKINNVFNLKEANLNGDYESFGKIIVREVNYDLITSYNLPNLAEANTGEKIFAYTSAIEDLDAIDLYSDSNNDKYFIYADLLNSDWKLCTEDDIELYTLNNHNNKSFYDFIEGKEYNQIDNSYNEILKTLKR